MNYGGIEFVMDHRIIRGFNFLQRLFNETENVVNCKNIASNIAVKFWSGEITEFLQ